MDILGLVGSRRKLGNSEILVKTALKEAQNEGASVSILRLSDLYIQECNGCMACAIKGDPCRFDDDLNFLIEQLDAADGLILSGPSYLGMPLGIFQTIQSRLVLSRGHKMLTSGQTAPKKAITIGVAGGTHISWWLVPLLNLFTQVAGFQLLESFIAGSQGPGEVLLPERSAIPTEVKRMAKDLVFALRGEESRLSDGVHKLRGWNWHSHGYGEEKLFTVENCCPYCFGEAFTPLHGDSLVANPMEVECAFCHNSTGEVAIEDGRVVVHLNRKTDEQIMQDAVHHFQNWVMPSGPLYLARRDELNELRAQYKESMPWVTPPGRDNVM